MKKVAEKHAKYVIIAMINASVKPPVNTSRCAARLCAREAALLPIVASIKEKNTDIIVAAAST
jgi:hypothetical protein